MHERLKQPSTHLPDEFHKSFELCFAAHDAIAQILVSGANSGIFTPEIDGISPQELETKGLIDLVERLDDIGLIHKLPQILISRIFPTILSDFLHCIFEALEASRKGKLCIAYMLLRKPIQDNLMVLESIIQDEELFAERLSSSPPKFNRGDDIASHTARVSAVLTRTGFSEVFSAEYIAKLRYDKNESDSFDGICNKANHITTSKSVIKTKKYDLNFIFPSERSMHHQWSYLFSRLPYLLSYTYFLCDHISRRFAQTLDEYTDEIFRIIGALYVSSTIETQDDFRFRPALTLAEFFLEGIAEQCRVRGYTPPSLEDLESMGLTGAFPGEPESEVAARRNLYEFISAQYAETQ